MWHNAIGGESSDESSNEEDWICEAGEDRNRQENHNVKGSELHAKLRKFQPAADNLGNSPPPLRASPAPMLQEQEADDRGYDDGPNDIDNSLAPPEVEKVACLKAEGNDHFKAGRFAAARDAYAKAADVYDGRKGGDATQRAERVRVCSNLAEASLKVGEWLEALKWAEHALVLEPGNAKARLRRARALAEVGGLMELDTAILEVQQAGERDSSGRLRAAEADLLARLTRSRKALHSTSAAQAEQLRKAFASGGGLGSAGVEEAAAAGGDDQLASVEMPKAVAAAPGELFQTESSVINEALDAAEAAEVAAQGPPASDDLMDAFAKVSKNGPEVSLVAFEKAEWLCAGVVRGEAKFNRFRANPSMRAALLDVEGGVALVEAMGFRNTGPKAANVENEQDWYEGAGDAEMRRKCEAALALFGRMKKMLKAGGDSASADGESGAGAEGGSGGAEEVEVTPVDGSNGGEDSWGTWSQTRDEVIARVAVPRGTRASDLSVEMRRKSVRVCISAACGAEAKIVVGGDLSAEIVPDDSLWQLGAGTTSAYVELTLAKVTAARRPGRFGPAGWWASVLKSDPQRDVGFCDAAIECVKVDKRAARELGMAPQEVS